MDWTAATKTAQAIADGWTAEAGPGGAVLLFDEGGLRASACGGFASIEHALRFTPDTAMRYASISKHFLCALLARDGRIGFDDRLGQHIAAGPAQGAVTVGRALDMTSGLADAAPTLWLLGNSSSTHLDRHALLDFVTGIDALNYPPGTEISYTNSGYRMVQAALEAKGTEYGTALRDSFFRPLGLSMHLPEDESEPVANLATGYWHAPQGWRRGRYGLHYSASGGITGTARDLASWAHALLVGRGPAAGLLDLLSAPRALLDGTVTGYGLGLARAPLGDHVLVGHGGSLPGYKNHFLIAPRLGAGVVVLCNREAVDPLALCLSVMAALTGTAEPPPAPDLLPEGRFIAEDAPIWIEHKAGVLSYLDAQATLFRDGADAVSRAVELPMRLRAEGGGIVGTIGHVARCFRPAQPGAAHPHWAGEWICPAQGGRFSIAVAGGQAALTMGAGPMRRTLDLLPIAADMALLTRQDGPWSQRACLHFTADGIRLLVNRSRVLRFVRA
ncbi:MAG: beta-lactamase family protein [Acetobacteraceae bacterium]|nr:beta-lactamase family protein [Acetobacteraceae bacterium]